MDTGGAGERSRLSFFGLINRNHANPAPEGTALRSAVVNRGGVPFPVMFQLARDLNIDLEQRDHLATIDLQPNLIRIDGDVLVDGGQNIFAKNWG